MAAHLVKKKALMAWSGGKDSAMALHTILQQNEYEIVSLLTTLNADLQRITMHGVREELLDAQARALNLPIEKMKIREGTHEAYEQEMERILRHYQKQGISSVIFGDILLEDLRQYREEKLAVVGMEAVFPLWQKNTRALFTSFCTMGFKALTCCVDARFFSAEQAGIPLDMDFMHALSPEVDPCGENGEYHSFVYDGPVFKHPVPCHTGTVEAHTYASGQRYFFCDILPGYAIPEE